MWGPVRGVGGFPAREVRAALSHPDAQGCCSPHVQARDARHQAKSFTYTEISRASLSLLETERLLFRDGHSLGELYGTQLPLRARASPLRSAAGLLWGSEGSMALCCPSGHVPPPCEAPRASSGGGVWKQPQEKG